MVALQEANGLALTSGRILLAVLSLMLAVTAIARESDSNQRNNLILAGTLPHSAVVRVWVSGPEIKVPIEHIIPTPSGVLQIGIAVPPGVERHFRLQAADSSERVLFEGDAQLSIHEVTQPVELSMKSTLDGSLAIVMFASHRVAIEATRLNEKESALTRLEAKLYDADGRVLDLVEGDIQWDINDPWVREHAMPCKGGNGPPPACIQFLTYEPNLLDVAITACFKEVFCRFEYVPPEPPVWRSVSVGLGHHACALKVDGDVFCWGQGEHGQLGVAVPKDCEEIFYDPNLHAVPWGCSEKPVKVQCAANNCNFIAITAGFVHTCAIDTAQDAWCWGNNFSGELGNGVNDVVSYGDPHPQRVIGGHKFTAISAGFHFTCGLATDHRVYCWGHNSNMIVPNSSLGLVLTPTRINLVSTAMINAISVDAGWAHVCAQAAQGRLYCWGSTTANNLLGANTFVHSPNCSTCAAAPVLMQSADIPGLDSKWVDIASAGMSANCAHVTTGETVCWGSKMPLLHTSPNVDRLAVGGVSYCGVISGTALCAGSGKTGVLGDGSFAFSVRGPTVPLALPRIFREIDVGLTSACAISGDDKLYCWGANNFGKLGIGAQVEVARPTAVVFSN